MKLPKGRYVIAVSGGVDSVSLMHMLKDQPGVELVVAHFDHGMRPESPADREFVQGLTASYGLQFFYKEGGLGAGASEAAARAARYGFLDDVRRAQDAQAIVTAHHRDDVLETAIINLLRGSGRKGLTSLGSQEDIRRPLLDVPKDKVITYAKRQGLQWREDSTNADTDYLRNYVRHRLLPRFDAEGRAKLWGIITDLRLTNAELDELIARQLSVQPSPGKLDRSWFIALPHDVAREVMASWLRSKGRADFDSRTLERLVAAGKTAAPGKSFDIMKGTRLRVGKYDLALEGAER